MRKVTKEYNVYTFDELSKEVQEKLIESEKEAQHELYCDTMLEEDMTELASDILKNYFGEYAHFNRVLYDLSYCQGSGAMIDFDLYGDNYDGFIAVRHSDNCRYYHENSFIIDDSGITDKTETESVDLTDEEEKALNEKIYVMNRELAKSGYKMLEGAYDDNDYIIDILKENEYLESGEVL